MKNKKQNNQSIFHYLIFDWQLKMERTNDTLIITFKTFKNVNQKENGFTDDLEQLLISFAFL